ncbi:hypothetical protein CP532_4610 [Ophiocordyceps camponoti-leonardi (nom. inval.)]|nr:hypothetical protein CP532_4610 [Ophiocordyceps camponoti-leonardi (nom. inval.)]
MMLWLLLLFHVLVVQAASPAELSNLANHPSIKAYLKKLGKHFSLRLSEDKLPYSDREGISEPVCPWKFSSCSTVYFYKRFKLIRVDKVDFSAVSNIEASLTTAYDPNDKRYIYPAKVTITESTAVTESTTKGWKVSLKLDGAVSGDPTGSFASGGAAVTSEYGEEYTSTTTTTRSVSIEAPCEAGKYCTIQTLTYQAHLRGKCRIEPIINCGGEEDACLKFEKTTDNSYHGYGVPQKVWKWQDGPCRQWRAYSRKNCRQGHYSVVDCTVSTPVLNRIGKPYSFTVITKKDLPPLNSTNDDDDDKRWAQIIFTK